MYLAEFKIESTLDCVCLAAPKPKWFLSNCVMSYFAEPNAELMLSNCVMSHLAIPNAELILSNLKWLKYA